MPTVDLEEEVKPVSTEVVETESTETTETTETVAEPV